MRNLFFPDEEISKNDLYFICYMIERVARRLKQPNRYVTKSAPSSTITTEAPIMNLPTSLHEPITREDFRNKEQTNNP